jgi:sec-independent protein translocase protein TatA
MGAITPFHIILIIIVALLLFGPNKLPELGKAFGKTLKEFKNGTKEIMKDNDDETQKAQPELRKELRSEKVNVQEAQYSEVTVEEKVEKKPQDNRRLPD